jgi:small subunit ribosomal protein S16e
LQKTAVAVAFVKPGKGLIKLNGRLRTLNMRRRAAADVRAHIVGVPIELLKPEALRYKVFEPVVLIGKQKLNALDIRIRVKGGGHVSQVYGASTATYRSIVRARDAIAS